MSVDIKPYHPSDRIEQPLFPAWVELPSSSPAPDSTSSNALLPVQWSEVALKQLRDFLPFLQFYGQDKFPTRESAPTNTDQTDLLQLVRDSIDSILANDPRTLHSKTHHNTDRNIFAIMFDQLNIVFRMISTNNQLSVQVLMIDLSSSSSPSTHDRQKLRTKEWYQSTLSQLEQLGLIQKEGEITQPTIC